MQQHFLTRPLVSQVSLYSWARLLSTGIAVLEFNLLWSSLCYNDNEEYRIGKIIDCYGIGISEERE
ncbi:hypothetical protein DY000_02031698 [Brassica cretica]|uniref:Uncharacterized protein n=1 Tax=Brassica cretica TaxID=69181 RepID=A0ABQ7DQH7_BRACR|nr:hypothetical protein DY000_02031698 [Brassica cretica]